ncbi:MAG: aldo/keto reductase [Desulfobacterales bacterium]|nr:MAG: aldo/keto reductase [Desulfobacterales bacterium]
MTKCKSIEDVWKSIHQRYAKVLGDKKQDELTAMINDAFVATKFGIVFDPKETGTVDALAADDFRNNNPRFQGDNLKANKQRFAPLIKEAEELGITTAQLSLAWLLHQGEDIIPIPGSRKRDRVSENADAAEVILSPDTVEKISKLAAPGLAQGKALL